MTMKKIKALTITLVILVLLYLIFIHPVVKQLNYCLEASNQFLLQSKKQLAMNGEESEEKVCLSAKGIVEDYLDCFNQNKKEHQIIHPLVITIFTTLFKTQPIEPKYFVKVHNSACQDYPQSLIGL